MAPGRHTPARLPAPASRAGGFTLIELVMVIVILSVLSAAAVPRFTNLSQSSRVAAVERAAAAFSGGVQGVRARWTLNGGASAGLDDVAGFGDGTVDVNDDGFPTDTAGSNSIGGGAPATARCVRLWTALMTGAPPVNDGSAEGFSAVVAGAGHACVFTHNGNSGLGFTYTALPNTIATITVDDDPS